MAEAAEQERDSKAPVRGSRGLAAFEVVWIFLIFFLFAGGAPPDVGESHYLVKAKHYWQPAWCAGDLFAESRDAHGTFYWTFGWVTRLVSLTAAAWIGRAATWLWLAWTWRRLSFAVVPRPLAALLSAGLLLFFLRHFHMAGEWVVGGVEAKGFAYGFVFLALERLARRRWDVALVLAGAAGTFHVLVGGWLAVAIGLAWLMPAANRPKLLSLAPAAAIGFVLALPGLMPALLLNQGVPAEVQNEGARLYVFERLGHHLVLHRFEAWHVVRFQLLVIGWGVLAWVLRKQPELCPIHRVVTAAIGIAVVGAVIDQWFVWRSESLPTVEWQTAAAKVLRYYWFRLCDALVPAGAAIGIVAAIARLQTTWPIAGSWSLVAAMAVAGVNLADVCYWRSVRNVPAAVLQPRPTTDSAPLSWFMPRPKEVRGGVTAERWYRDWQDVCAWVQEQTPADAMFLTPQEQQTFKWYAGRGEVVNWKDVPQDARGLVEWKRRMSEVYPRDDAHRNHDLAAFSDKELMELARKYGVRYVVVDETRAARRLGLKRVYPVLREQNQSFGVYRIPE
jgi:hypothetical protein